MNKLSRIYPILLAAALMTATPAAAQVGINNSSPDASAELDVKSTTRGFLAPRMTGAQMTAIGMPAAGLAVYNTDSASYCIYSGSAWLKVLLSTSGNWSVTGNDIYSNNSGNVGIGTTAPQSKVHVQSGNFLVSAVHGSGNAIEVTGAGSRLFFNPLKSALRAGYVQDSQWDPAQIGEYSVGLGTNNTASGAAAVAMGDFCTASGTSAVAFGLSSRATGTASIAGGFGSEASGFISVALGQGNLATGSRAVALGQTNTASGDRSFAANSSNTVSGSYAAALGISNTAASYGELCVGSFSTTYAAAGTSTFQTTDRLFNVGNGTSVSSRSDAFTILKSGATGIGNNNPASTLDVNGSIGMKVKAAQVAGTHHPDGTASVWIYGSGTGTITLPSASSCSNRTYTIVNNTGGNRTSSSYVALGGSSTTTIANATSVQLISDGTNWYQVK
ncbi:hypothetical protein [Flaviaesturariibacter amylovorans]|uniref:Trimeric autotransporter adhesin YadA-like head domain-containing protein n=1 Tax=Flaviaesturariibacter amylovorans TaxID=1084520 RepID=A0ABP8GXA4_9BACT